ncbi:hypothetical protein [Enterococcus hermanniensis]|uniref:Uncharacterized protein n=1 Tax=Enterococcus hermanniensis TaxID=249189 RepID=A0A1L8TQS1_9ENTE|nr:hypothetical protein [Enterococcus hermanniensis]OJG46482.1 hypothetical protein RV04_GL000910 [Enterococcus hermanniensis]
MLHREILSPKEVLDKIPNLDEGVFAIRCEMPLKTYQVILYKYQEDFFSIENPALLSALLGKNAADFGSSDQLLDKIEVCFEDNHYEPTTKEWVTLDLNTLKLINNVEVQFFDLEE